MGLTLGIDPGRAGGLAWIENSSGNVHTLADMPDATGAALAALLRDLLLANTPEVAWIEKVGYMPGQQGRVTFAENYGVILGVMGAYDIPTRLVTPAVWKRSMGLTKRKDETKRETKTRSRQLAVELFPSWSVSFSRVKDDGRAEAALIATHGWRERGSH